MLIAEKHTCNNVAVKQDTQPNIVYVAGNEHLQQKMHVNKSNVVKEQTKVIPKHDQTKKKNKRRHRHHSKRNINVKTKEVSR